MPVCAKMILSWVRKVLHIAKVYMAQGAVASVAMVGGASLATIMKTGYWATVSTPARHYLSYISILQIGTRILCSMLSWALVSR